MKNIRSLALIFSLSLAPSIGEAADLNSIAKLTSSVSAKLSQIQKSDFISVDASQSVTPQTRTLRHVYMQARKNHELIQALRDINGLDIKSIPPMELKSWDENDILTSLESQLTDLKELNKIYNFKNEPEPKVSINANPTEIYSALLNIHDQIISLGIPGQAPKESYQYSSLIVQQLTHLANKKNVEIPALSTEKIVGKTPNDNYLYAQSVVAELQYLNTEYAKIDLDGGVVIPNAIERKADSSDVVNLLQSLLAEIVAIKVAINDTNAIELPPLEEGRTPSDVYKNLEHAYNIIFAIEDALAA